MNNSRGYYVYVYIDPRNFEEFYYGKGKGRRRIAHLSDESDSQKVVRIKSIQREGLEPIIRTIAANLTESEAHLIETTLIWKLGRTLTNDAAGKYVSLFRPQQSFHREIPSFDYSNDIYFVNIGEGSHRSWDDCRAYGFISAGQGAQWKDQLGGLSLGDVVVAYLKRHGYVGVGSVAESAMRIEDFRYQGRSLRTLELSAPNPWQNSEDIENSEYLVRVNWRTTLNRENAKWQTKSGLYTTQLVKASLANQPRTIEFINEQFGVDLFDFADDQSTDSP